jgi:hypothetical protein
MGLRKHQLFGRVARLLVAGQAPFLHAWPSDVLAWLRCLELRG